MQHSNAAQSPHQSSLLGIGTDITKVRGQLALLGWPSLSAWAREHGYQRMTVAWVITSWGDRTDREPHGWCARAVARDLRHTLATGKRPKPVDPALPKRCRT